MVVCLKNYFSFNQNDDDDVQYMHLLGLLTIRMANGMKNTNYQYVKYRKSIDDAACLNTTVADNANLSWNCTASVALAKV